MFTQNFDRFVEGVRPDVDLHMGTLSKAVGLSGGYIAGRRPAIDLIIATILRRLHDQST